MAYKYKTFDFIPKPITKERLEETFLRIVDDISADNNQSKYIKINKNTIINENDIYFIKRDGMKLIYYTASRQYESYNSFTKIEKELSSNFIRCHKSYIANTNKITRIDKTKNLLYFDKDNLIFCYIGPKYKNKTLEVLNHDGNITNNMD